MAELTTVALRLGSADVKSRLGGCDGLDSGWAREKLMTDLMEKLAGVVCCGLS